MKEKGLNVQYVIVKSMIHHLEYKVPIVNKNNRMKDYVQYLAERTKLKPNRIRRILDNDINKRITISECNQIAQALGMDMYTLCSYIDINKRID